jgi:hypothetical protein
VLFVLFFLEHAVAAQHIRATDAHMTIDRNISVPCFFDFVRIEITETVMRKVIRIASCIDLDTGTPFFRTGAAGDDRAFFPLALFPRLSPGFFVPSPPYLPFSCVLHPIYNWSIFSRLTGSG